MIGIELVKPGTDEADPRGGVGRPGGRPRGRAADRQGRRPQHQRPAHRPAALADRRRGGGGRGDPRTGPAQRVGRTGSAREGAHQHEQHPHPDPRRPGHHRRRRDPRRRTDRGRPDRRPRRARLRRRRGAGPPTAPSTRPDKYVIPGGVDAHTHMELPFGGTFASDTFETGTRAAAWGGTTTIVDFAVQTRGPRPARRPRRLVRQGRRQVRHRLRLPHDPLRRQRVIAEGDGPAGRGGHHLLQAVHGLPRRLLQRRRPDPARHAARRRQRRADHDARRERHRHRRPGRTGPRRGPHRPALPRRGAQGAAGGRGHPPRHPARPGRRRPAVRRPRLGRGGRRRAGRRPRQGTHVFGETCPQYLFLSTDNLAEPDFEGAKYVCSTPLRPQGAPGGALAGAADQRPPGGLHRPLPVLLHRPEGAGPRRLLQDPQRAAGRGEPDGPAPPGRRRRAHHPPPLDRDRLRHPGPDVRPLPAEGHHRARAPTPTSSSTTRTPSRPSPPRPTT